MLIEQETVLKPPIVDITCPEFSEVLKPPLEGLVLERSVWSFPVGSWLSKWKLLCCKCLILHSWLLTLGPRFAAQLECLKCRMHSYVIFLLMSCKFHNSSDKPNAKVDRPAQDEVEK